MFISRIIVFCSFWTSPCTWQDLHKWFVIMLYKCTKPLEDWCWIQSDCWYDIYFCHPNNAFWFKCFPELYRCGFTHAWFSIWRNYQRNFPKWFTLYIHSVLRAEDYFVLWKEDKGNYSALWFLFHSRLWYGHPNENIFVWGCCFEDKGWSGVNRY